MTNKLNDEKLNDAVGGKHIPYPTDETPTEVYYSFTSGEKIFNSPFAYYMVKNGGSYKSDEDVLCDAYAASYSKYEISASDVKIKALVLNTYRNSTVL